VSPKLLLDKLVDPDIGTCWEAYTSNERRNAETVLGSEQREWGGSGARAPETASRNFGLAYQRN